MTARLSCRLARLIASTIGLYLSATAGLRRRLVIAQTRRELDALRERGLEHLARNATVQA